MSPVSEATTNVTSATTNVPASSLPPDEKHEEALPRYKRDLVAKMKILRTELQTMQPQSGHCRLEVSRAEIFEVLFFIDLNLNVKVKRYFLINCDVMEFECFRSRTGAS